MRKYGRRGCRTAGSGERQWKCTTKQKQARRERATVGRREGEKQEGRAGLEVKSNGERERWLQLEWEGGPGRREEGRGSQGNS